MRQPSQISLFGAFPPGDRKLTDVCARRHRGARNSVRANERLHGFKVTTRERIRVFIGGCGWGGATLKEICSAFGKLPNELSGRLSELKADKVIFDSGRDRNGCAVLVGRPEWVNGSERNGG